MPAAGLRNTNGSQGNVGSNGYYWSSTAYNASNGYILNFGSSWVNPQDWNNPGNGFAVRCVRQRTCPLLFFSYLCTNFRTKTITTMILVTASEFRKNQKKYFQIALSEKVGVKSGNVIFEITPSEELHTNPSPSGDPFWDDPRNVEELKSRIADLRSGKSKTIPLKEFKQQMDWL